MGTTHKVQGQLVPFNRSSTYLIKRAQDNFKNKHYLEAIDLLRRALENGLQADALLLLANIYSEMRCYRLSNRALYALIALDESDAKPFYLIATNHYFLGDHDALLDAAANYLMRDKDGVYQEEARQLIEWALMSEKTPLGRRYPKLMRLALGDEAAGNSERAIKRFARAIRLSDAEDEIVYMVMMKLVTFDLADEVIGYCLKWHKNDTHNAKPICALVTAFVQKGQTALAHITAMAIKDCVHVSGDDEAVFQMALLMPKPSGVLTYFQKALEQNPYDVSVMHYLAHLNLRMGNVNRAVSLWHQILAIDFEDLNAKAFVQMANQGKLSEIKAPFKVPKDEMLRRADRMMALAKEDYPLALSTEDAHIVSWMLSLGNALIAGTVKQILTLMPSDEAIKHLKKWMLDPFMNDSLHRHAAYMISMLGDTSPQVMLFGGKLSYVTNDTDEMHKSERADFIKRFMIECRELDRANAAVQFAARHYDRLDVAFKRRATGADGYAFIAAMKILFLRSFGLEKAVEAYINELLISLRRVQRAMKILIRQTERGTLDETDRF